MKKGLWLLGMVLIVMTLYQTAFHHEVRYTSSDQVRKVCLKEDEQQFAKDGLATLTRGSSPEVTLKDDDGSRATVVFSDEGWKAAPPATNIHMVADLDACIHGTARHLDFVANGEPVGYADPVFGIKVFQ